MALLTSVSQGGDDPVKLGFCDSQSGKQGCAGERRVTLYKGFYFCAKCWPHRVRLAKQLASDAKRKG